MFVPDTERKILVKGIQVHTFFFSYNPENPIAIMIHGHRADTARMMPVIKLLEPSYNIISFDLPGFGKTTQRGEFENYIHHTADVLDGIIGELGLETKAIALFGVSLGANVIVQYLIDHPEARFKKLGIIAPTFSHKYLSMKPRFRRFVMFATKAFSHDKLIAKLAQKVVSSDRAFNFIARLADKESYHNENILAYERQQWRLMTMQHWGKTLYDFLEIDYTSLNKTFAHDEVYFVFPRKDQYLDSESSIREFKKMFPHARFNYFESDKHIPKGDYMDNPELVDSMKRIIDALD